MNLYPFINVTIGGKPVSTFFYERLHRASIHDAPGNDSDSCSLVFDDKENTVEMPSSQDMIDIEFGFLDGNSVRSGGSKMGRFVVEKPRIEFGEQGEFLVITGRAAQMGASLKEPLSEHFDNMSPGDIVEELAKRHGHDAKVDDVFKQRLRDYTPRVNQSTLDFLQRLGDRTGALFTIKNRTFLFLQRGQLAPITIHKSECESGYFEIEPRPRYKEAEAGWFERSTAKTIFERYETGLKGPVRRLRTIHSTRKEALQAAKGEAERLGRATGSGSLTFAGRPEVMADTPIIAAGFRDEANGLWRCSGADHEFEETYMTTAALEAPEEGKTS